MLKTFANPTLKNPFRGEIFPLCAPTLESLGNLVKETLSLLAGSHDVPPLHDLCYTASVQRSDYDHRLAFVVYSHKELIEQLESFLHTQEHLGISSKAKISCGASKLVFVFPGQGSQWFGMGRQLLEEELVFRASMEKCDQVMRQYVDWSLLEEFTADETRSRLDEMDVIQPILFSLQVSLAAQWKSWGIVPDAVVGHSMGEIAAACFAGALSLEEAARVICYRSQLLKRVRGTGAMAAVGLSFEQAQEVLTGYEERLSIAASNGPTSTVLSGDTAALEEVVEKLQRQGIFSRWVKILVASHSPQVDSLHDDLLRVLDGLKTQPAFLPIYSTVTGQVSNGLEFDASYWVHNMREPVLFWQSIQQLLKNEHNIFVEISAHPILLPAIERGLNDLKNQVVLLPSLKRQEDERAVMLKSLADLYSLGQCVDWTQI